MKRRTKIICTLGPATDNPTVLSELMLSGMNSARLNFSHGSYDAVSYTHLGIFIPFKLYVNPTLNASILSAQARIIIENIIYLHIGCKRILL